MARQITMPPASPAPTALCDAATDSRWLVIRHHVVDLGAVGTLADIANTRAAGYSSAGFFSFLPDSCKVRGAFFQHLREG